MPLVRIQIRRDTAANWTSANPVLAAGEPAIETDTGKTKTGDGIRNWSALPYEIESGLSSATTAAIGASAAGTAVLAARADHSHPLPSTINAETIAASGNVTVGGTLSVTGALTAGTLNVPAGSLSGLSEAIDDRVDALLVAGSGITKTYDDTANTLTLSVGSHTQAISTVTGLQAALDGKAAETHTHAIADVTDLAAALAGRPTSNISATAGAAAITNIVAISQAAYTALSAKDSSTLYVIT